MSWLDVSSDIELVRCLSVHRARIWTWKNVDMTVDFEDTGSILRMTVNRGTIMPFVAQMPFMVQLSPKCGRLVLTTRQHMLVAGECDLARWSEDIQSVRCPTIHRAKIWTSIVSSFWLEWALASWIVVYNEPIYQLAHPEIYFIIWHEHTFEAPSIQYFFIALIRDGIISTVKC